MQLQHTCPKCGAQFTPHGGGRPQRFCSRRCRLKRARATLAERFWKKVDRSGGPDACWLWLGARDKKGYGNFGMGGRGGKTAKAPRVAWELTRGPIPAELWALHSCDNPPCCNPAHLFLGTNLDNIHDAMSKGRLVGNRGIFKGERNVNAKLNDIAVRAIRARYALGGTSYSRLAVEYGVSLSVIHLVVARRTWRHVE